MVAILDFSFLCIYNIFDFRLCGCVYVEMISAGQPFTAGHILQTPLAFWVQPGKRETLGQCWFNVGSSSTTLAQQ